MAESVPPWGDDALSRFLADASENERVSSLNLPRVYALLRDTHDVFRRAQEAIEIDNNRVNLLPRLMFTRAQSAFLAATRLGLSGQFNEAQLVVRAIVEQSWYALHIARDPSPPARANLWWCRNDDAEALARCRAEFKVGRVRASHEAVDAETATSLRLLYDMAIDYGAHPNQKGLLASVTRSESGNRVDYSVGILHPDAITVKLATRMACWGGIGCLKVIQCIYPERFALVGLDRSIVQLVDGLNTVFKATSR